MKSQFTVPGGGGIISVFDDVLPDPEGYRQLALAQPFRSVSLGPDTFHGIADPPDDRLAAWFRGAVCDANPSLSFLRQSPAGQIEPNDIHTDEGMGAVTAILYLNPDPPKGDGTIFWQHASGAYDGPAWEADGHNRSRWTPYLHVPAAFNRVVMFSAPLFHSRAVVENYGAGRDARLIQVLFAQAQLAHG